MKQLFFFTSSFPYGLGENWKMNELDVFKAHFQNIFILPFCYAENFANPKQVPQNVTVFPPLHHHLSNAKRHLPKILFSRHLGYYLKDAFAKKVYKKKNWLFAWVVACIQTELCLRSLQFRQALSKADADSTWYFYWGFEWAYIIPFLKQKGFKHIFFRVHGPDIYEEKDGNTGYLPFREPLYQSAQSVIVLSQQAKKYIETKNYDCKNIVVAPLGTVSLGKNVFEKNEGLQLVTCSRIVEVKRLWLIARALQLADMPVTWTHIGDGPLRKQLENEVSNLPSFAEVHFTGQLTPDEAVRFYGNKHFDLFLNVSSSEGMPVAIMEAFAAGIPVMATAVGGVPEMVNETNGVLLNENISAEGLWQKIKEFKTTASELQLAKRQAAFQTYEQKFRAVENAELLVKHFNTVL